MAFNQFQIDELNKIEGFGKAYEKGSKQAAKVAGDVALLMIPGLGTIKLARAGGKLTQSAMEFVKRARKMYPKSKINGNPTAKQIAEAKPMGNVKLKTPAQVAANVQKSRPRATPPGGKPTTIKDKPRAKPDTKTVEKVPPKPAAPGLKKNRRRVDGKPIESKPVSRVKSTRKLSEDVKAAAAKRAAQARMRRAEKVKGPAKKAAAAAGIVGAGIALDKVARPKKAEADKRKPTGTYSRKAVETTKPKSKPKRKPTGTYNRDAVTTGKPPAKQSIKTKTKKDPIQGKAPTNGNKVKPSPKTTTKKKPKTAPRKEVKPERKSDLPAGVLRKFQGTLRKDEVIRNINGVSYVIKRKDSAFAGKKR